jgi:hypothetical protein
MLSGYLRTRTVPVIGIKDKRPLLKKKTMLSGYLRTRTVPVIGIKDKRPLLKKRES